MMIRRFGAAVRANRMTLALFGLALGMTLLAACGGSSSSDGTPSATHIAGTPTAVPSRAAGTLVISANNLKFDQDRLETQQRNVTVEFDNIDEGVPHNIHFKKGAKASGESVAKSDVESGPATQIITFDAEPGQYYYQCDVHPSMKGLLTVGP